jgi:hypothetical protein
VPTGRAWPTPWATGFLQDMAYLPGRGLMCQTQLGFSPTDSPTGIHCVNLDTGAVGAQIVDGLPFRHASGLAYRADDDSFYAVSGQTVHHVKGLSAVDAGAPIGRCDLPFADASGLAYNADFGVLWVSTQNQTDTIYQVDPASCQVLAAVPHPSPGFQGGGLDLDPDGNLWTVQSGAGTLLLVDSGLPAFRDVSWLSGRPASGTLAPGGTQTVVITANAAGLAAGTFRATLIVASDAGRERVVRVPVTLRRE